MAVKLSPLAGAGWQFFDNLGIPLAGGLLYTYTAGTTTPQATYTSSAGTIASANPIVLDSAGRTANEVWLTVGVAYKFVLQTPAAVTIGTYDNVSGINDVTGASFAPATGSTSITTLGTITTGVWNATPIGVAYGGTGLTSIPARSIPVANVANTYTTVTPAAGQSVRINAGNTAWEAYTPASSVPTPNVQTFNSTGSWTKPTGYTMARIQLWGGGGGGMRGTTATNYGGGGGGYNEVTVPISYLDATVTITIGSAGTGRTGSAGDGTTGGASNVPLSTALPNGTTTIYAYGGGGGSNTFKYGGGEGGQLTAGSASADGSVPGLASNNAAWNGGQGYSGTGFSALFGGGGGGTTTGGSSVYGGAGGANSAGVAPGGGGGASVSANVNGFDGAVGKVVITCW
jgi:hypothetical protein